MANIKDLKKKIKTTKSTLKITSAMKLVSAAKLAKAQQAITKSRPYATELADMIKAISSLVENYEHHYFKPNENPNKILLVISSNKGMCGGYNTQLAKTVKKFAQEHGDSAKVYFVGRKVKDLVINNVNMGKFFEFEKQEPDYADISAVAKELADIFKVGEIGEVHIAYNRFISAIAFEPTVQKVLPMALAEEEKNRLKEKYPFDFKYEPAPEQILNDLVPQVYLTSMYTCLLDAIASEYGSRMSAMDNATRNCKDMIKDLTLKANKIRQASITTELIEVISGAESLNN